MQNGQQEALKIPEDSIASAKAAQLRYTMDWQPGIRRKVSGKAFIYIDVNRKRIRNVDELNRIRALAVPPAWTDVWICPWANGHVQASGRDARGRKQYRYHTRWREVRDENKYARMVAFAQALPRIRSRVDRDLALPGLPRAKVLATIVKLLDCTFIRVGNDEYAQSNQSYGLATMRHHHVKVTGSKIQFEFRGKSRVEHAISIEDRRLARIIKRCQDLPGYELFQYADEDGTRVRIEASDVNDYLREIVGSEFSTKDFRTWAGTVLAASAFGRLSRPESNAEGKRQVVKAVEEVARLLGNTKAVCRKCYIHPCVIDGYTEGSLLRFLNRATSRNGRKSQPVLSTQETAVLAFLQQQQNGRKKQSRPALAARRMSLHARLRQSIKAASRTRQSPRSDMRRAVKSVISG